MNTNVNLCAVRAEIDQVMPYAMKRSTLEAAVLLMEQQADKIEKNLAEYKGGDVDAIARARKKIDFLRTDAAEGRKMLAEFDAKFEDFTAIK